MSLWDLNCWLYHRTESMLCSVKLIFLQVKVSLTDHRIAILEARLTTMR